MTDSAHQETQPDREIVVSALIGGPPDLVFGAFTSVDHLSRWWGPDGFSTTTRSFRFEPGGTWKFTMHGPDGTDYPEWIQFVEIVAPERIVLRHGEREDDPEAFLSTITFRPVNEGTEVTLTSLFPTTALRDRALVEFGAEEGGRQTLGRLEGYVETAGRS